ncbi:hypothetical protein PCL1606_29070 [Pseudomonas chlororaphis]|uniref:Uncharacterized protein n=1 Tax=Pseudomonas chlororaphis TaxID=587753 RepID=A0A0D5Y031_9PSED|nr:hypothetical protein PCL1606_29070 [Pseudomonas chlororaphis]
MRQQVAFGGKRSNHQKSPDREKGPALHAKHVCLHALLERQNRQWRAFSAVCALRTNVFPAAFA